MVILRSQNKITDFFMILAWASPFKPMFIDFFVGNIQVITAQYISADGHARRSIIKQPTSQRKSVIKRGEHIKNKTC